MTNSSFVARGSKVLPDDPRLVGGSGSSSAVLRAVRSAVTALIALSLGIALVSWLKGGDEVRPSGTRAAALSGTSSSGAIRLSQTR
jgi:hypothetical protein